MAEVLEYGLSVMSLAATIAIPIVIARAERKSGEQLERLQASQEQIQRQLRRDAIMDRAATTRSAAALRILWSEVDQFDGDDRRLLRATFRQNDCVSLPGARRGAELRDTLDTEAVHDYVQSLEARYARPCREFDGLLKFLEEVVRKRVPVADEDLEEIASVLTGDSAVVQEPTHWWYMDAVTTLPSLGPRLLASVSRIPRSAGVLHMNALSGILEGIVAVRDREIPITDDELRAVRYEAAYQLTMALQRDLRHFDVESSYRQHRQTPEIVAVLIEVASWAAGTNGHLAMRMMESLPAAIRSIPDSERSWGAGAERVRAGLAAFASDWPDRWEDNRDHLEAAADAVGKWRE